MNSKQENGGSISYSSILKGGMVVLIIMVFLTVLLGILTNFGWSGLLKWSGGLYMIVLYLALVVGSIFAGMNSSTMGWVTGMGVGIITSVMLLILTKMFGEGMNWYFFTTKSFLNCFIGAFGGIIGINLSKR